jgi:FimV-like protein
MRKPMALLWSDFKSPDTRKHVVKGITLAAALAAFSGVSLAVRAVWIARDQLLSPVGRWLVATNPLPNWQVVTWVACLLPLGLGAGFLIGTVHSRRKSPSLSSPAPALTIEPGLAIKRLDEELTPPVEEGFAPNLLQMHLLLQMLTTYPTDTELREAHQVSLALDPSLTPAHTERELTALVAGRVLSVRQASDNHAYYRFTPQGRDFALLVADSVRRQKAERKAASGGARKRTSHPSGSPMLVPQIETPADAGPLEGISLSDLQAATMSEVGTKLDLARAYKDMGDPAGARSILNEVLSEGSEAQRREARRLLSALK